eukprot:TRINITY_DN27024_c0_g1_i2.p1 TRINITY_DN27024_c0_g1~~TRINITY_DN27024_c0_g1_i2.p1  ORF type:complete len:216 (-),score=33.44 TRINITY_DN27024_c0_g1_i2:261-908(-)
MCIRDSNYTNPRSNPMTALGFQDIAIKGNHKGVILSSAYSTLSKMTAKLLKGSGIKVIGIIRQPSQEQELKNIGVTLVLNQMDKQFNEKLKQAASDYKATAFFDGVAGKLGCKVFWLMPNNSIWYSYGIFSLEKLSDINPQQFIFKGKQIQGFWQERWFNSKTQQEKDILNKLLKKKLENELKTKLSRSFKLEQVNEAISFYQSHSNLGKVYFDI